MSANFNNIRFYSQWNSAVLLRTLLHARHEFTREAHTSFVTSHYIVLHPGSSRSSRASGLCVLIPHSRHISFTSWLDYIGILRCSTAEIVSHYDHVLTLSVSQVNAVYLCHHLRSETRPTGHSMGLTIGSESALDLVKQMERGKERNWRKPRDESILQKFRKPSR